MIQESGADKRQSLYLYTDKGSYEPLARIDRNGNQEEHIYYFHTDLNGLPEELTDEAGEIVWECSYQLWGKPIQEIAHTEIQQNLRYQGQYLDRETGLHYNIFRYYDPDTGRFTQPDPIGLLGGYNLYQYAPNALTWIDPWGLAFSSGKGTHTANATLFDNNGNIKSQGVWQSGNMTPSEAALGFPKSTLATHTEARITVDLKNLAQPGDKLVINGQYPPCNSCKGKMNKFAKDTGAKVSYHWDDNSEKKHGKQVKKVDVSNMIKEITFLGTVINCYTENDVLIIGIGNDKISPNQYLIISKLNEDEIGESIGIQTYLSDIEIVNAIDSLVLKFNYLIINIKRNKENEVGARKIIVKFKDIDLVLLAKYINDIFLNSSVTIEIEL